MQERAELLGGSLDIQSEAGQGTTITVEIAHHATTSCPPSDTAREGGNGQVKTSKG